MVRAGKRLKGNIRAGREGASGQETCGRSLALVLRDLVQRRRGPGFARGTVFRGIVESWRAGHDKDESGIAELSI